MREAKLIREGSAIGDQKYHLGRLWYHLWTQEAGCVSPVPEYQNSDKVPALGPVATHDSKAQEARRVSFVQTICQNGEERRT